MAMSIAVSNPKSVFVRCYVLLH